MTDAAQKPNVNDIWSLPDPHPEALKPLGSPESGPVVEVYQAPEVPKSVEREEITTQVTAKPQDVPLEPVQEVSTAAVTPNVKDLRTGKEKTHRVAPAADSVTKQADLEEQEFIEGVEQVHSIV
ncbi:hypothetical protein KJ605_00290 [Patescibacteria group bacterium]|nr:hypothetical protein [Patescibacteria group bacterium]MBU1970207.1 hypothetical protein [Patescibacteria group bacterium]